MPSSPDSMGSAFIDSWSKRLSGLLAILPNVEKGGEGGQDVPVCSTSQLSGLPMALPGVEGEGEAR